MDIKLPDGVILRGIPEGTTREQILGRLLQSGHGSAQALMQQMAAEQTARETSAGGRFLAATGLAFKNMQRGAEQMIGLGDDAEIKSNAATDRELLKTPAGLSGNVTGTVAALAPLAVVPGANTAGGAAVLGSTAAALQPAGTGERLANMAIGGALGGGTQAFSQAPMQTLDMMKSAATAPFRTAQAAVEPFYESGRQRIVGRTIKDATGGSAAVEQNLRNATELVPGSMPTAAEAGGSAGLAALQRSAAAVNPQDYALRATQQNEARLAALQDMAGVGGRRNLFAAIRDQGADEMYGAARALGVNPEAAQILRPQIKNLMERVPAGVVERARELARINGEVLDASGSVNGLHWMKVAVDDLLSSGKQTGIGNQTQRALMQYKDDLLTVIDELSPAYAQARTSFAEMSRPVNQMDIARLLLDKSVRPLDNTLQPAQFARNLTDNTAARATGFNGATLANTLEPEQVALLNALREDMRRSVFARDAGRGAGSDTVQKLAMTNLMQRSGIPQGVLNAPMLGRMGNWLYSDANVRMQQDLANALLNPRMAAQRLQAAPNTPVVTELPKTSRESLALLARALAMPSVPYAVQR